MNILIIIIPIALLIATCFVAAFIWATFTHQYDDVHTPAVRMLFEEETVTPDPHRGTANESRE